MLRAVNVLQIPPGFALLARAFPQLSAGTTR